MPLPSLSWSRDETLWRRWCRHAEESPGAEAIAFIRAGEETLRWSWGDLIARARKYATWLSARGVREGDTCALISRHEFEFYPLYMGVCALGAIPAVLAYPNERLHPDKFRDGLVGMARYSGLDWVLTEAALVSALEPLLRTPESTLKDVLCPYEAVLTDEVSFPAASHHAHAPALLQHSSGTTGLQKAVVLSHKAILEHVSRYATAIAANSNDRVVSWLPLYHDMGLIAAFHLPLAMGIPTVHLSPFEWVMAPVLLIEALSAERGTLCWLPNFAYAVMASRLHDDELAGLTLDSVRLLVNCSEPVRAESQDALLHKLAPCGLRRSALGASYAMAEATFAVTQTVPGAGPVIRIVARDALTKGLARAPVDGELTRVCVSSGIPIDGCDLGVIDEAGLRVLDGDVGEIIVRSVSQFDGYRNRADKTSEVMHNGWYHTGDYGFIDEQHVYIVGRKKDLIILAGKNIYPEDIEDMVSAVIGILPGRVVAFGGEDLANGTERVVVIAETDLDRSQHRPLRARVVAAAQSIDVTLSEVHFVPARWLVKSSAGKPSRSANRARVLTELTKELDEQ